MKLLYKVQFDDDFCLIQDKSSLRMIDKAKLQQDLFLLHISTEANFHHSQFSPL